MTWVGSNLRRAAGPALVLGGYLVGFALRNGAGEVASLVLVLVGLAASTYIG